MLPYRTGRPVLFFALARVFLISSLTFAQNSDSLHPIEKKRSNSLAPGAWALQFQITQDFTLNAFQGVLLSAKKHFSGKSAVRFGLGLSASMSDADNFFEQRNIDTIRQIRENESEANSRSFDIAFQYLVYPSPAARVNLFLGTGPFVRHSHSRVESEADDALFDTITFNYSYRNVSESNRWSVGAGGLLGAEWFATRVFSLHAEYGLTLEYTSTESRSTYTDFYTGIPITRRYESNQNGLTVGPSMVKFGLSVYF